jgi:hypothetical protein
VALAPRSPARHRASGRNQRNSADRLLFEDCKSNVLYLKSSFLKSLLDWALGNRELRRLVCSINYDANSGGASQGRVKGRVASFLQNSSCYHLLEGLPVAYWLCGICGWWRKSKSVLGSTLQLAPSEMSKFLLHFFFFLGNVIY